ncbi:hypothetical protein DZC73_24915 [Albitalea terrae]|uniref:Uncharacterized protein n=2 Tax=Piscinibacter terrae TaxID=2496871 RepID=A0A3N7HNM0_9BURK|nr:hypothetical protein DZC73_24915 [Albitalea terrae]
MSQAAVAADRIVYPRHQALHDPQLDYVLAVLRMAVDKSGASYDLEQSPQVMVQSRAFAELGKPHGAVDIVWAMTDIERERNYLPVRIPIDKGLIGWRLALVRQADVQRWHDVRSISALSAYVAGQMHDWPDTAILRANGLKVSTTSNYEGLFQQVAINRIDYFPRSLIEIGDELASHPELGLAVDPYLVIRYPTAFYFFVSPHWPDLAVDLTRGMEAAIADGSFDRLFDRYFGELTARYRLKERTVLNLTNPLLPAQTPLTRKGLWFQGMQR